MDNVSFTAIPRAKYNVKDGKHVVSAVTYQLEHSDLPVVEKMLKERGEIQPEDIFGQAFIVAKELLEHSKGQSKRFLDDTKIIVARVRNKIAGILIYNEPRVTEAGKLVNSSRKGAKLGEMELDWIATNPDVKVGGIGKALSEDLLYTAKTENYNGVYIRSAIDKKTKGVIPFHRDTLGAKTIGEKMEWEESIGNPDVFPQDTLDAIVCEGDANRVIPMMISKKTIAAKQKQFANELGKERLIPTHVNLADELK